MRSALFACTLLLTTSAVAQQAPMPAVNDPQLAPPPTAPRTLQSWDEALSLLKAQSPDYRSTVDNIARAAAQTRIALSNVLPNLSGQISFTHQFITIKEAIAGPPILYPLQDVWGVGATLLWPIGDPHAWYGVETARENEAVSQLDLAEKRRELAQSVVVTMLATLATQRIADLNRIGLQAALERLSLARTRFQLGGGAQIDVERAEQDLAAARALVITGDESLREAREALGLALGSSTPIAAPGDLDLAGFEKAVAGTCQVKNDIEQRPDIVAAKARVSLAERGIKDVWLQFAPSIVLGSQFLWNSQVLYGPDSNWDLAAMLNVPLWDGGARYGRLRDARLAMDQAEQALGAARLNALVNTAQANRSVGVSEASREVARQQRDLSYSVDQRTREGYMHGLGTSLDLVTSAQALRQAEINLAVLDFQVSQARAQAILSNADCLF